MIEWRDEGVVLAMRPHGENAAIAELFTAAHGRHAGVVRGGTSRRMRPLLQPGSLLDVTWRARLDDHVGAYSVEPIQTSAALMERRETLAVLNAVAALLLLLLPERDPHPGLYARTLSLLGGLAAEGWPAAYLRWEAWLLEDMGYGLDLGACAVTGGSDDLAFVSPRTGRAVSRAAAGQWSERLLPLPRPLRDEAAGEPAEVLEGLRTTGHFLARMAAELADRPLPPARDRLLREVERL